MELCGRSLTTLLPRVEKGTRNATVTATSPMLPVTLDRWDVKRLSKQAPAVLDPCGGHRRAQGGGRLFWWLPSPPRPALHRLTYDDVVRMYEAGILADEARVEVLEGLLIDLTPPGPTHDGTVEWLTERFVDSRRPEHRVRVQSMLRLASGDFVLPDLMVVDEAFGRDRHPTTAPLVIEVAQTSQAHDRKKAAHYAAAVVEEYWIVDIVARVVTVHRDPSGGGYTTVTEHRDGSIRPLIGTPEVQVDELLGPPTPPDQP